MREELREILHKALPELRQQLDPDHGLLQLLLAQGVLNNEQIETCKRKELTRHQRIDAVVDSLMCRPDSSYDKFRKVLQCDTIGRADLVHDYLPLVDIRTPHTECREPAATVSGNCKHSDESESHGQATPRSFREAFMGKVFHLSEVVDVHSGLLDRLTESGVITEEQQSIIEKTHPDGKCYQLLKLLEMNKHGKVEQFIECLNATNQHHAVACILNQEGAKCLPSKSDLQSRAPRNNVFSEEHKKTCIPSTDNGMTNGDERRVRVSTHQLTKDGVSPTNENNSPTEPTKWQNRYSVDGSNMDTHDMSSSVASTADDTACKDAVKASSSLDDSAEDSELQRGALSTLICDTAEHVLSDTRVKPDPAESSDLKRIEQHGRDDRKNAPAAASNSSESGSGTPDQHKRSCSDEEDDNEYMRTWKKIVRRSK